MTGAELTGGRGERRVGGINHAAVPTCSLAANALARRGHFLCRGRATLALRDGLTTAYACNRRTSRGGVPGWLRCRRLFQQGSTCLWRLLCASWRFFSSIVKRHGWHAFARYVRKAWRSYLLRTPILLRCRMPCCCAWLASPAAPLLSDANLFCLRLYSSACLLLGRRGRAVQAGAEATF